MALSDLQSEVSVPVGVKLAELLEGPNSLSLVPERVTSVATGFDPLDTVLGGGLKLHDMVVLGGRPGVGKTIAGLQWARSAAMSGATAIVVSYEHDAATIFGRLFAMEVGMLGVEAGSNSSVSGDLSQIVRHVMSGDWMLNDEVGRHPLVRAALARLTTFSENLVLVPGSTKRTDLAMIEQIVQQHATDQTLVVVDYIQKVPDFTEAASEQARIRSVAEGLKQVAIDNPVSILAIAAANEGGLDQKRIRLEHLRGAQSLAYECDVLMMLNSKWSAVSRKHITFDPQNAEEFKKYVVFSVEKNRTGPDFIDLEFEKAFQHYRFEPRGRFVSERLIDGAMVLE